MPHLGEEKKSTAAPFKKGDKKEEKKAKAFYGWDDFSANSIHIGEDIAEALIRDNKTKPKILEEGRPKKEFTKKADPKKKKDLPGSENPKDSTANPRK